MFGQRRAIVTNATLTGDTTLIVILADEIFKINVAVTSTSTDSCMVSFDPTFTIGGNEVVMDSIAVYASESYSIWDDNYPIKYCKIHNRDGAVTRVTFSKYSGRQR